MRESGERTKRDCKMREREQRKRRSAERERGEIK